MSLNKIDKISYLIEDVKIEDVCQINVINSFKNQKLTQYYVINFILYKILTEGDLSNLKTFLSNNKINIDNLYYIEETNIYEKRNKHFEQMMEYLFNQNYYSNYIVLKNNKFDISEYLKRLIKK